MKNPKVKIGDKIRVLNKINNPTLNRKEGFVYMKDVKSGVFYVTPDYVVYEENCDETFSVNPKTDNFEIL